MCTFSTGTAAAGAMAAPLSGRALLEALPPEEQKQLMDAQRDAVRAQLGGAAHAAAAGKAEVREAMDCLNRAMEPFGAAGEGGPATRAKLDKARADIAAIMARL